MTKFRIGLGVSGGIAVYKAVEVLRLLQKARCDVSVAMTRHATEFVRPLTFRALTERHVIVDDYDPANPDPIAHINFSQNIDLLLIVPATANIIAKFANGVADDFLSSTYLATTAPVMIAPAMNTTMWDSAATQRNVERLRADGVHFAEPVAGELACKTVGTGKLGDVENIVSQALDHLNAKTQRGKDAKTETTFGKWISDGRRSLGLSQDALADLVGIHKQQIHRLENSKSGTDPDTVRKLAKALRLDQRTGLELAFVTPYVQDETTPTLTSRDLADERFLITVGGTREAIDPVRFISNHSSGKMGFAVAEAAAARGAKVTVVAGATTVDPPANVKVIRVVSAEEMHAAVTKVLRNSTIFVGAAAVADYAPGQRIGCQDQERRPRVYDPGATENAGYFGGRCEEPAQRNACRRVCRRNQRRCRLRAFEDGEEAPRLGRRQRHYERRSRFQYRYEYRHDPDTKRRRDRATFDVEKGTGRQNFE